MRRASPALPVRAVGGALALALAAASIGACRDRESEETPAAVAAAVEGISALPASVDVVLGADVPALARSALVERAVDRLFLGDPGLKKQLDLLFEGCHLDPTRDLRSVLLAMDTDAPDQRTLLVASGHLDEAALTACVSRHMARLGGALTQKPVGGRTQYLADAPPGRLDVWFAFGSRTTVVVSSSPDLLTEALADGPRLVKDVNMARLIDRARRPGAAIWAAGKVSPALGEGFKAAAGGAIAPPTALFGHLTVESGLAVELGVDLASPADANRAVSLAKQQLAVLTQLAQKWKLGRLVAKVAVDAAGHTMLVRAAFGEAELRAALGPVDSGRAGDQTTAPIERGQGVPDGERDAAPGGQAPVPEQGKADR